MRYSDTTGRSVICSETSAGATKTCEVLTQLLEDAVPGPWRQWEASDQG